MSKNLNPKPLKGLPLVKERIVVNVSGVEPHLLPLQLHLNHYYYTLS